MKKTIKTIALGTIAVCVLTFFLTSCHKQPSACINQSATSVYSGDVVKFTSCSNDAYSQTWTSDNGKTSNEKELNYKYETVGSRTMKLDVYSKNDRKHSSTSAAVTVIAISQKYSGSYTMNGGCFSTTYTLNIVPNGDSQIKIYNWGNSGSLFVLTANISGSSFTILPASFTDNSTYNFVVNSGSGTLNGNALTITVNFSDYDLNTPSNNLLNYNCPDFGNKL